MRQANNHHETDGFAVIVSIALLVIVYVGVRGFIAFAEFFAR